MGEVSCGMLASGTCSQTDIARYHGKSQQELKHTIKRFQRMLKHTEILDAVNEITLNEVEWRIHERTIIAIDGGDITHAYGNKFENIAEVKDGSVSGKEIKNGYHLQQVCGYNIDSDETFPIMTKLYSSSEKEFQSENRVIEDIVLAVTEVSTKGLWVMDRGYDRSHNIQLMLNCGLDFVVRMKKNRNIIVNGRCIKIEKAAEAINRRHKRSRYRFGYTQIRINMDDGTCSGIYGATLIAVKMKRKRGEKLCYFITNAGIHSSIEIDMRITGYFKRWSIEEAYRFEKQGFGIEKSTTRNFSSIKSLLGITLFSWLVLLKCKRCKCLKKTILKAARMEKTQKLPKFLYYRLLKGIQMIFRKTGDLLNFHQKNMRQKINNFAVQLQLFCESWLVEA